MKRYSKTLLKINLMAIFVLSLFVASRLLLAIAEGSVTTAATDGIDEIVAVGTDGYVYVYDYNGNQVFRSAEGGWNYVATADLNNDNDQEIIAVGANTIKVYDPQVAGTAFEFTVTYGGSAGQFTQVDTGNLIDNDNTHEIALLRSVGNGHGRIIIYDPPNTNPAVDVDFLSDWRDFAIGDYDGDEDDDFALIYWNPDNPSGSKNLMELRKGHNPDSRLENSSDNFQLSDSEWFDIVTADLITTNGDKVEWVGTQNLNGNIIAQRWSSKRIKDIWSLDNPYNYLAAADFRGEGRDQVAMLRNVSGTKSSLRFVAHVETGNDQEGVVWVKLSGLGSDWLNLAAGNVDTDQTYREAVLLKGNLIRVYRITQSTADRMDCNPASECLDISGSFKGALALGDLGVDIKQEQPIPYEVLPANIGRAVMTNETATPSEIYIYGEKEIDVPINWNASILPYEGSGILRQALKTDENLSITITSAGVEYKSDLGSGALSSVSWLALSDYTGVTPATVTVSFSNTTEGAHRAMILVWQYDLPDDRFRFSDVTYIVGGERVYLPLVLR